MIIKIDNSLIKYIKENSLEDDENVIKAINSFLRISQDNKHLVVIDILLIGFIKKYFEQKIDQSCLETLNEIAGKEVGGIKVLLTKFPIHINVTANSETKLNEIRVLDNEFYDNGKIFEVNLFSLCDYSFLGERVSILSEYDTDVELYSLIGKKYLDENYNNLSFKDNKINPGYGGNIKKAIEVAIRNNEKTLIICDTDKITLDEPLRNGCTLESVEGEFEKIKDNNIVHLVSLDAHEKENLIPISWLQEFDHEACYCCNSLELESSVYSDRLLFLDFKKGLTKKNYESGQYVKEYYQPAIEHLQINLEDLGDDDYIFSGVHSKEWNDNAIQILNSKRLSDYPEYLKSNIKKLGLFISCWIVSGRKQFNKAKSYVEL